jgi:hypothetical protein
MQGWQGLVREKAYQIIVIVVASVNCGTWKISSRVMSVKPPKVTSCPFKEKLRKDRATNSPLVRSLFPVSQEGYPNNFRDEESHRRQRQMAPNDVK